MKYTDIDIKTARKCCKQHCYKNKKGQTIPKCETCPLERKNINGRPAFCWFQLKELYELSKNKFETCPLLKAEYDALCQEDVSKTLEWENWINSQESMD